jgi:hypothetical protein
MCPLFGADFDLVFVEDGGAAFADGFDPAVNGEDVGRGCAVGRDADGDEAGVGEKELAEAGAIFIGRSADGGINGGDELVERCGGGTGWSGGCLGAEGRSGQGSGESEENGGAEHGEIL